MPKLPVKYFKTVTEYAKYNWSGSIDKLYPVVKTVTKNFTRTDPVYVRIGEDGEPEIHYTMTQADGSSYFANMDLGDSTIYVTNTKQITNITYAFQNATVKRVIMQYLANQTPVAMFQNCDNLEYVEFTDGSVPVNNLYYMFSGTPKITVIPKMDFSATTSSYISGGSLNKPSVIRFLPYGVVVSFNLSETALKHDAILEVFNNLGTVDATAGITLTLGSDKLALMSDEEKAIATGKGWVLA